MRSVPYWPLLDSVLDSAPFCVFLRARHTIAAELEILWSQRTDGEKRKTRATESQRQGERKEEEDLPPTGAFHIAHSQCIVGDINDWPSLDDGPNKKIISWNSQWRNCWQLRSNKTGNVSFPWCLRAFTQPPICNGLPPIFSTYLHFTHLLGKDGRGRGRDRVLHLECPLVTVL